MGMFKKKKKEKGLMPMEVARYFHLKYAQTIGKGRKYARQKIWGEINGDREDLRLINTFKNHSFLTTPIMIYQIKSLN